MRRKRSNLSFYMGLLGLLGVLGLSLLAANPGGNDKSTIELACGGDPVPTCGTTYVLSLSGPFTVPNTGAVTILLETTNYFDIIEIPPGSGVCPPAPYFLTLDVTGVCPVGSPFPTSVGPILISTGVSTIPIPVTFPVGPNRECQLNVVGTVTLSDGSTLSQTRRHGVCIVQPSPLDPTRPRLSLDPVSPTESAVHPGDQASHLWRLRNNDPAETWVGSMDAMMLNTATRPVGPTARVFAVSDPSPSSDTYPMKFADSLPPGGCVPLPPNPHEFLSHITRTLTLAPGESRDIEILVRPWGMCANGSCGQKTVRLEGTFSDGTRGFACAAATIVAATGTPPSYAWVDAGRVLDVLPNPSFPPRLMLIGMPDPTLVPRRGQLVLNTGGTRVQVGPNIIPINVETQPLPIQQHTGRLESIINFPPQLPDSFFDVFFDIQLNNLPGTGQIVLQNMDVVPNAPTGVSNRSPIAMGVASVAGLPPTLDSFFDVFYQISGSGVGLTGASIPIEIVQLQLTPHPTGGGMQVHGRVRSLGPGSEPFTGLVMRQDFRGYARLGSAGVICNDIDFNNDGSLFDPIDIDAFLSVFGEGPCIPAPASCDDIDFNNDTSLFDPCDIDSFLLVFSEGPCTLCGT